jgi:hypothetical protein
MEQQGHDGWHWTDMARKDGAVTRWTGIYVTHGCPGRLCLGDWCQKPAGHEGWHNNGRGTSFSDPVGAD